MLKVGERAPEIDALASDGSRFVLSAQQGLCTVLYFFPKAFTPTCTAQTHVFRENYAELALAGAAIVGISTDDMPTQCKFSGEVRTPFPLVPDPDKTICRAYDVLRPILRVARRITYVIGPDLKVAAVFQHEFMVRRHRDDVLAFVDMIYRASRPAPPTPPITARLPSPAAAVPRSAAATTLAEAPTLLAGKLGAGSSRPPAPGGASASAQAISSYPPPPAPSSRSGPRSISRAAEVIDDRFELERRAASGASGDIFRAIDRATGRAVALKILRTGPERDEARFEREARILADLDHPGIVAYVAHGIDAHGNPYLATEWLEGENLQKRLGHDPPLTLEESLALGLRVATTLGVAHARGIIHRDLKPSNLFLPGGDLREAKLLDFGVSRPTLDLNQLTAPGDVIGTPGYMAPEQARGKGPVDARADVFALGCVMFRCLTGREAFTGHDLVSKLLAVITQEVPPAHAVNPSVPEPISMLVARMLSRSPEGRPPNGQAVAEDLARLIGRA